MGWDALLSETGTGEPVEQWCYTHNINVMANLVLYPDTDTTRSVAEEVFAPRHTPWWQLLDGCRGPEAAALLGRIVSVLRADPGRFRALNPPNGWGDYDTFVEVLEQMRDASVSGTTWRVYG